MFQIKYVIIDVSLWMIEVNQTQQSDHIETNRGRERRALLMCKEKVRYKIFFVKTLSIQSHSLPDDGSNIILIILLCCFPKKDKQVDGWWFKR